MLQRRIAQPMILVACAFVCACFPLHYDYFEPNASTAHAGWIRSECGGPPNSLTFRLQDAQAEYVVHLTAQPPHAAGDALAITIEFARWPSAKLSAAWKAEPLAKRGADYRDWLSRPVTISVSRPTAEVEAAGERMQIPLGFVDDRGHRMLDGTGFYQRWSVPGIHPDEFTLRLPVFAFDGKPLAIPPVTFRRKSGVFATPINC
jgi:hypothetical protein